MMSNLKLKEVSKLNQTTKKTVFFKTIEPK
jgi:hypothetical protein